ncbi:MAG: PilN domain-containing protein [Lysobacteraceae bacterium]|jgi:type IV pilus assembly protein PilN|uniref:PilN domain-containing protein n=1 Tax=Silanimonas sp. TaxID=1929290 RepID=UPI0022CB2B97|nr:PilN domain-containing protein [Silanimonas sp.]MCZ8114274.1 PilN domain-containing protein [Silanimonas sp.]
MARINLLPWRAERRKQRQKEFGTMLGGALIAGVALVFAGSSYYDGQTEGQTARNDLLKQRIEEVKRQITEIEGLEARKANLLQRKQVIEDLQADRSQNVRLFEELVRTIPDGVRLVTITQTGSELKLAGRSQSESRVSAYMRNLEASGLINNPRLSIIKAGDATQTPASRPSTAPADRSLPFGFEMTVTLRSSSDEAEAENGDSPTGATPSNAPAAVPSNAPTAPAQAS